ncbi:MAG TPA: NAD-dependent epimerase/dehydratase family protein [Chitinophagaceae bacterium]|nr:NAD-dependent epimerase/dehydratase family protein [Chitinophagaceae bacterium]
MVIGNGLIATAFKEFENDDRFVFFCSGVSNSLCREQNEFDRETRLVEKALDENKEKEIIYFSTTSVEDPSMKDSLYVAHKLAIEQLIQNTARHYCIFRLSNVVGKSSNQHTILNFLFNNINTGRPFELWKNSSRNFIDVADVVIIVKELLRREMDHNMTINIAHGTSYGVPTIVSIIESYLGKKGNYTIVDKGVSYAIDISYWKDIIADQQRASDSDYISSLLRKYYPL